MGVWWCAVVLVVGGCVGLVGCGGEEAPLFDPGTFSGMHEGEIRKDCTESLQCMAQRGEEVPDDPVNKCVTDTASLLESDEDRQMRFQRNYARCSPYVVCAYYDCATSNATGFADAQVDKVTHDCQATIDCSAQQGQPIDDPTTALRGCINIRSGVLDGYSAAQQQQYLATYANCMMFGGCEFSGCFGTGVTM